MGDKNSIAGEKQYFKIFFVGDAGVGKTLVINKIIQKPRNSTKYKPTYGHSFVEHDHVVDGRGISFQLWDTAGSEEYRSITKHHYEKGIGAVIVYDITKEETFCNVKHWIEEIKTNCMYGDEQPLILVLGNKKDLQAQRRVPCDEARQIIQKEDHEIYFMEITALDPIDNLLIEKVFQIFFAKIYQKLKARDYIIDSSPYDKSNRQSEQQNSNSCCC